MSSDCHELCISSSIAATAPHEGGTRPVYRILLLIGQVQPGHSFYGGSGTGSVKDEDFIRYIGSIAVGKYAQIFNAEELLPH
jgi:hypothetical protein